ncbi:TolC family protein [Hydrogenovibrio kuenenii]|uniref:TolC family protein n=1 Tax=Hydrogenovibrio kuenenii TaxID=63658 RepID=UPI001FE01A72|nr:TolC family protein [Hydrogenovibrio kuenenii]
MTNLKGLKPIYFSVLLLCAVAPAMAAEDKTAPTPVSANPAVPVQKMSQTQVVPQTTLPDPLTLESIMNLPHSVSPQVLLSQAKQQQALAKYQQSKATDGVELDLMGRLGWREYANETQDNHLLALHVGKQLYDFGKTEAAQSSQLTLSDAESELNQDQVIQFQLRLMQGFFNVILSDYQYRIDNEDMATVYVTMDKAKDKHELGQISDVEYSRLQAEYEKSYVKRMHSEYEQRRTRTDLANLLGQPQNLPDKLKFPSLKGLLKRPLKSLDDYQKEALANNLQLQSLKLKLKAANYQMESQSAGDKPTFRVDAWGGKLSSYEYQREGRWRFDLSMDYPLYDSGSQSAKMSEARAKMMQAQADVKAMEQSLRDQVADVYFKLQLNKAQRKQNTAFSNYADLYLDYSRGLYENESKTDLGDSMVRLSEANYQTIMTSFQYALDWAKLGYLTGQAIALDKYR